MTYKEFKKEIERLKVDFKFYDFRNTIDLVITDTLVVTFFKREMYPINIYFNTTVDTSKIGVLLDLLYKLIRTPINDRDKMKWLIKTKR